MPKRYKRSKKRSRKYGRTYKKRRTTTRKRKSKRSSRSKKTKGVYSKVSIPRQITANRMMIKLPYWEVTTFVLTSGATPYAEYVYLANSIYDPNSSGSGHQPRGHDQWSNLYTNYLVHGVSYNIELRPTSESAITAVSTCGLAGVRWGSITDNTLWSNVTDLMEAPADPYSRWRRWAQGSSTTRPVSTEYGAIVLKGYVNCRKLLKARLPDVVWPQGCIADMGASPPTLSQLEGVIWMGSLPTQDVPVTEVLPTTILTTKLVYYVELLNPIYVGIS